MLSWQEMPVDEQPKLLKTFTDGLNHQTHLIESKNKRFVLKLFSSPSPNAITAHNFASQYNLAPEILYVNEQQSVALLEYIETDSAIQPVDSQELISLGTALKKLHALPNKSVETQIGKFDLLSFYQKYLANIGPDNALIQSKDKEIKPIVDLFLSDTTDWCICHNDLVKENCFITGVGTQFIDWEYAQINNPWFDLVTVIYSLKLDNQQVKTLIEAYDADLLPWLDNAFFYSALVSMLWCDILWNIARDPNMERSSIRQKLNDIDRFKSKIRSLN